MDNRQCVSAALLTGDIPGRNFKHKDSLVEHYDDCDRMNIEVVPPDVNHSFVDFAVRESKILFGLAAIKGCGGSAGESIVAAREKDGPFKSIFEFCERVDPKDCNRATIETLIKAGAFDVFGAKRKIRPVSLFSTSVPQMSLPLTSVPTMSLPPARQMQVWHRRHRRSPGTPVLHSTPVSTTPSKLFQLFCKLIHL